jgi:hypothetical protein
MAGPAAYAKAEVLDKIVNRNMCPFMIFGFQLHGWSCTAPVG